MSGCQTRRGAVSEARRGVDPLVGGWRKTAEGGLETGGRTTRAPVRHPPLWKTAPPLIYGACLAAAHFKASCRDSGTFF
ncbi:MAG: hypothetical protein LBK25_06780 [Treponema sp.]|nr:hypothetical protein [Treponema sp.]